MTKTNINTEKCLFDEKLQLKKISSNDPLKPLSERISWEQFVQVTENAFAHFDHSQRGGQPSNRLLMFKALVLLEYLGLDDDQMEFQLLDRVSFQPFIGQRLQYRVPDAKTISLFRQSLTESGVLDELFIQYGKRLRQIGLAAHKGKLVKPRFAKVPVQRNSNEENRQIQNGELPDPRNKHIRSRKETDTDRTKKNKQSHYGYKQRIKTDLQHKIIPLFEITPASIHDLLVINQLLEPEKEQGKAMYADSVFTVISATAGKE